VPFRNIKEFDAETLRNMTQAFDAACDRLRLGPDDPLRADLATAIIGMAAAGEREPGKLFARVIEELDI
jgi:hypothetical protein